MRQRGDPFAPGHSDTHTAVKDQDVASTALEDGLYKKPLFKVWLGWSYFLWSVWGDYLCQPSRLPYTLKVDSLLARSLISHCCILHFHYRVSTRKKKAKAAYTQIPNRMISTAPFSIRCNLDHLSTSYSLY